MTVGEAVVFSAYWRGHLFRRLVKGREEIGPSEAPNINLRPAHVRVRGTILSHPVLTDKEISRQLRTEASIRSLNGNPPSDRALCPGAPVADHVSDSLVQPDSRSPELQRHDEPISVDDPFDARRPPGSGRPLRSSIRGRRRKTRMRDCRFSRKNILETLQTLSVPVCYAVYA